MPASAPVAPAWAPPSNDPPSPPRALGPCGCGLSPEGLLLLPEGLPVVDGLLGDDGWKLAAPTPMPVAPTLVAPAPADPAAPAPTWLAPAAIAATVEPSLRPVPA